MIYSLKSITFKRTNSISCCKGCRVTDCSCIVGEGVKLYNYFENWQHLITLNIHLSDDPAIHLPSIYPRKMEAYFYRMTCVKMFIAALFIIVKNPKHV